MAGYDPKQKRAHSPTAAAGPAPVDDLLGGLVMSLTADGVPSRLVGPLNAATLGPGA